jgi:hypothetical protein
MIGPLREPTGAEICAMLLGIFYGGPFCLDPDANSTAPLCKIVSFFKPLSVPAPT